MEQKTHVFAMVVAIPPSGNEADVKFNASKTTWKGTDPDD